MRTRLGEIAFSLLSVAVLLVTWEVLARKAIIPPLFFPPPSAIWARMIELLAPGSDFYGHVYASFVRFALGALIAVPPAVLLGVLIGMNRYVALFLRYPLALTYPVPKLAVLPLLLVVFGIGDESKIAMVAIGIFYLLLFSTIHGVQRLASLDYLEIAAVYRIPFLTRMLKVVLRGILPDVLNGLKLGLGYGLVMVVAGEFVLSRDGIGLVLWRAWDQFRLVDLYCGLLVLSLAGTAIFFTCDLIKGRLKGFSGGAGEEPAS